MLGVYIWCIIFIVIGLTIVPWWFIVIAIIIYALYEISENKKYM